MGTATGDNDLPADVTACLGDSNIKLVPRAFEQYPWQESTDAKYVAPKSPYVNSLDYRLDLSITKKVDQTAREINFDGTDTQAFGLALFLKQDLVLVQDLVPKRAWNPDDGDSAKEFSK